MKIFPRRSVDLNKKAFEALFKAIADSEIIKGTSTELFEREFSKYIGTKKSLGVSSARAGLSLVLQSLGFNEGDEVIVPAYTFYAVPLVVQACKLKPVFIDSNPDTYNIDVSLIRKSINEKTKAIIVSHLFGQPAEMEAIADISREYNLRVIEDCAHGLGAEYKNRKVGRLGDIGIFSFGTGKNLPCFGGGMITINDDILIEKIERLRGGLPFPPKVAVLKNVLIASLVYLITKKSLFPYFLYPALRVTDFIGHDLFDRLIQEANSDPALINFSPRITQLANLQAAVGLAQLAELDRINDLRIKNAKLLSGLLGHSGGVTLPGVIPQVKHIYLYYRIGVKRRKAFRKRLLNRGIDSKKDDMSVCPRLKIFRDCKTECPVADNLSSMTLEIPSGPHFEARDMSYIAKGVIAVAEELGR